MISAHGIDRNCQRLRHEIESGPASARWLRIQFRSIYANALTIILAYPLRP